jgi:hypothetical protein
VTLARVAQEMKSLLSAPLTTEHTSHEVTSGARAVASGQQALPPARSYPEPDQTTAADRAAALSNRSSPAASWGYPENRSASPVSFAGLAQAPTAAARAGPSDVANVGASFAASPSPGGGASGHASNSTPATIGDSAGDMFRGMDPVRPPNTARGGSIVSDASRSSLHSEPQKPTDYLQILNMLEKVWLRGSLSAARRRSSAPATIALAS